MQFRVGKTQLRVQTLGVRVDGVNIIREVPDGITRKQPLEAAHDAVPGDAAHGVSVGTDLPGEDGHEVHEIGHILGQLRESAVQITKSGGQIEVQLVRHIFQAFHQGDTGQGHFRQNGGTHGNRRRKQTRSTDSDSTESGGGRFRLRLR